MERRFHTALFAKNCWERIFAQHCSHCYSGARKSHQLCSHFLFCMELRPPQARKSHRQKKEDLAASKNHQKPAKTSSSCHSGSRKNLAKVRTVLPKHQFTTWTQHLALTSIELYDGKSPDWTCQDNAIKGNQVTIATGKILAICFPSSETQVGATFLHRLLQLILALQLSWECHLPLLPFATKFVWCQLGGKNEVQNEVKTRSESWPTATPMGFTIYPSGPQKSVHNVGAAKPNSQRCQTYWDSNPKHNLNAASPF